MSGRTTYPASTRRDFLWRLAKACASVAGAGSLAFWLHDRKGPRHGRTQDAATLPDFSIPGTKGRVGVVTGEDRVKTVRRAVELLGGMETFVRPGDKVLLKVNAAFATPPILGATTHPDLVFEVAALCFKAGAASVLVADNPINDPASCFRLTGIGPAVLSAGATLVLPEKGYFRPATVPGGRLIRDWPLFVGPFMGVNKLIGIAPVKDHHRSGASMTMKNWYGLLGGRRNLFHQDIHNIIKELAMLVSPTLVILDGTVTMVTNGPTGGALEDLKPTGTMIVSTDQVAADALGATFLGKTVGQLPFIGKAEAAGLGTADYQSLHPVHDHVG